MRNQRGTAAVEMILALPVVMIFALAMLDFAVGISAKSQAARASRHVAWATSRGTAPGQGAVEATHIRAAHSNFKMTSVARETYALPIPGLGLLKQATDFLTNALAKINVTFLYGVPEFIVGTVEASTGEVSMTIPTRLRVFRKTAMSARHVVALKSYVESNAGKPMGWFDPYQWVMEKLNDLIEAIPILNLGRPL